MQSNEVFSVFDNSPAPPLCWLQRRSGVILRSSVTGRGPGTCHGASVTGQYYRPQIQSDCKLETRSINSPPEAAGLGFNSSLSQYPTLTAAIGRSPHAVHSQHTQSTRIRLTGGNRYFSLGDDSLIHRCVASAPISRDGLSTTTKWFWQSLVHGFLRLHEPGPPWQGGTREKFDHEHSIRQYIRGDGGFESSIPG